MSSYCREAVVTGSAAVLLTFTSHVTLPKGRTCSQHFVLAAASSLLSVNVLIWVVTRSHS